MGVPAASQPSLSHPSGAEPVPVSGKAGIANADALLTLAERVEQGTGPDQLKLLSRACHLALPAEDLRLIVARRFIAAEAFVSAAMLLIPEWAKLHFLQDTEYDNPETKTWSACLRARSWKENEPGFGTEWQSWCATPALALTAAALRARALEQSK